MKVIDLINMINNKEDLPEKMIINKIEFHSNVFKTMIYEEDCNTNIWMAIQLNHIDLDDYVNILDVELIEDETIDIDNIEELNDTCYDEENMISEEKEYYHNLTREQQNTILRAVKQLDKRVKELEELNIEINEKDINEAISKAREQRSKEIKSIKEK